MPNKDLFLMVMEAEGDDLGQMDAFDENAIADAGTSEDVAPPATEENSGGENVDDAPPEMASDFGDMGDLNSMGDDQTGGDEMSGENGQNEEEADQKDEKLSEKANNVLNQQLYTKFVARNKDIEGIVTSIKDLVPLLPYDVIKSNDKSMNQLKSALQKGQEYVINDFVDSGYGENLLFYNKLDSLYVLLLNRIDSNLKKIKNNES